MTIAEVQNWCAYAKPGDRLVYGKHATGGGRTPAKTMLRLYEGGFVALLTEHDGDEVRLVAVRV